MNFPTTVDPVKEIILTCGCFDKAAPHTFPSPVIILITPLGKFACLTSSASLLAVRGACSEDFRTLVFPTATQDASLLAAITKGKFHGVMHATTPTGSFDT